MDTVLDLASALRRDRMESPGRVVFFSDVTRWLDSRAATWAHYGVDPGGVVAALAQAPTAALYLAVSQFTHAVVCDASRQGVCMHLPDGSMVQATHDVRQDVRRGVEQVLMSNWMPYLESIRRPPQ